MRGVRWSDLAVRKPLSGIPLSESDIDRFRNENGVFIGHEMALRLGLKVGSNVSLTTAKGKATAFGTVPTRRKFTVAGIFNVGMYEYDSSFIFMPLNLSAEFLGYGNRVSGLEIYVTMPEHIVSLRQEVRKTVGSDLRVFDWIERNKVFLNALKVERNVMFLILTLIILVTAFNIISSMIMLVHSKNADIAVLRAMGASGAA